MTCRLILTVQSRGPRSRKGSTVSEHSVTVVRLGSTSSAEREEIVVGVEDLLLAHGVIPQRPS